MLSEKDDMLEFNQYIKWNKMPHIIYGDIEPWTNKIVECANDSENSSKKKKYGEHIPCRYAVRKFWRF